MALSDDEVRQIITDYDSELAKAVTELRRRRAENLQQALASGLSQADLVRATGKSREAIRQFLDPAAAEAAVAAKRTARVTRRP